MIPQQMQLQQIQIQSGLTGQQQQQFVNQDQQQLQNQIMQSQQLALQQQAHNALNASQTNGIQQITIQQPKQILVGQQSVGQNQTLENRPIMVSIGGNNAASSLNAMQNLSSPIVTSQAMTLQPPPNPLAAMTSLSYSTVPSGTLTNSTANMATDDKSVQKADDAQKSTMESTAISTSTSSTTTTIANASITISSATSSPTVSNALKEKPSGNLKIHHSLNEFQIE